MTRLPVGDDGLAQAGNDGLHGSSAQHHAASVIRPSLDHANALGNAGAAVVDCVGLEALRRKRDRWPASGRRDGDRALASRRRVSVDRRCPLFRLGVAVLGVVTVDDGVAAAGIRVYKARVPFVGKAQ